MFSFHVQRFAFFPPSSFLFFLLNLNMRFVIRHPVPASKFFPFDHCCVPPLEYISARIQSQDLRIFGLARSYPLPCSQFAEEDSVSVVRGKRHRNIRDEFRIRRDPFTPVRLG